MSAEQNKLQMQAIMEAMARGDTRPFGQAMADDFTWTIAGKSAWSRSWHSKQVVRAQLFSPLFAQFETRMAMQADRILADGDTVVVQARGSARTKRGELYENSYCLVCRWQGGKLIEVVEYMDTALAERVLVRV